MDKNPLVLLELVERLGNLMRSELRKAGSDESLQPVHLQAMIYLARANRYSNTPQALAETRSVWFAETGFVNTPVYRRDLLPAGTEFDGPLIVEQMDATTVVPPRTRFSVDAAGVMHLELSVAEKPQEAQWTGA